MMGGDINGYNLIELVGAVIKQALEDLKPYNKDMKSEYQKGCKQMVQNDAKNFIFSDRLDDFLKEFHLREIIEADYIRREAKKILRKRGGKR